MHLLDNLRQRIEAGHKDFLNELRACTVVFVGLPSLQDHRPGAAAEGPASVQAAVDVVQRRLAAAGGSLLQVPPFASPHAPCPSQTSPSAQLQRLSCRRALRNELSDIGMPVKCMSSLRRRKARRGSIFAQKVPVMLQSFYAAVTSHTMRVSIM